MIRIYISILFLVNLERSEEARRGKKREHKNRCTLPGSCTSNDTADQIDQELVNRGFVCPECHKLHCLKKNPRRLNCKGGLTKDVCGCCPVCAKVEGEPCGGRANYLGECDKGLRCEREPPEEYELVRTASPTADITTIVNPTRADWRGTCVRASPNDGPETCRPECTAEFCLANPKEICSARNTAMAEQECQGECQHTSCSACFFQEEPPCQTCRQNDFACIKKFAKCVKKKATCTRNKYPCKKTKKAQSGKFLCWVPKCF